jgi:hypothetical protein
MLQPGLGDSLTAVIDVKYNYFSQATLYFQAMSRQTLEGDSSIEISNKRSETADTPVKAAVNVNSPVIYPQRDNNDRLSQPFNLRATLNTDDGDVRYQVKDLYVENSDLIQQEGVESETGQNLDAAACDFADSDGNVVYPDDRMRLKINNRGGGYPVDVYSPGYDEGVSQNSPAANMFPGSQEAVNNPDNRRRDEYYWFDSSRTAPMVGCTMELSNPEEISPTGETLTVEVKSNYTVSKQDKLGSLSLQNNVCASLQCPLLVTLQKDNDIDKYDFKNECTGLDSGNGCSIINPASYEGWGDAQTDQQTANQGTDDFIESGEVAINLGVIGSSGFASVDENNWEELDPDMDGDLETNGLEDGYSFLKYDSESGQDIEENDVELVEGCEDSDNVIATYGAECSGSSSGSGSSGVEGTMNQAGPG